MYNYIDTIIMSALAGHFIPVVMACISYQLKSDNYWVLLLTWIELLLLIVGFIFCAALIIYCSAKIRDIVIEREEEQIVNEVENTGLQALQKQLNFRKWVESERAERDLSGSMDFCEGCWAQRGRQCGYTDKRNEADRTLECVCAKNYRRLQEGKKNVKA